MRASVLLVLAAACGSAAPPVRPATDPCPVVLASRSVSAAGMRFQLGAQPIRVEAGWGVRVSLDAASADGHQHWLEARPLHFDSTIGYAGGPSFISGEGETDPVYSLEVVKGKPVRLARDFPHDRPADEPMGTDTRDFVVKPGGTLDLEVPLPAFDRRVVDVPLGVIELQVPVTGCPKLQILDKLPEVTGEPETPAPPAAPAPSTRP